MTPGDVAGTLAALLVVPVVALNAASARSEAISTPVSIGKGHGRQPQTEPTADLRLPIW